MKIDKKNSIKAVMYRQILSIVCKTLTNDRLSNEIDVLSDAFQGPLTEE